MRNYEYLADCRRVYFFHKLFRFPCQYYNRRGKVNYPGCHMFHFCCRSRKYRVECHQYRLFAALHEGEDIFTFFSAKYPVFMLYYHSRNIPICIDRFGEVKMYFLIVLIDFPFDFRWIFMRIKRSKVECGNFAFDAHTKELLAIVKKILGKCCYSTLTRRVCAQENNGRSMNIFYPSLYSFIWSIGQSYLSSFLTENPSMSRE